MDGQAQSERTVLPLGNWSPYLNHQRAGQSKKHADLAGGEDRSDLGALATTARLGLGNLRQRHFRRHDQFRGSTLRAQEPRAADPAGQGSSSAPEERDHIQCSALIPCHTSLPHGLDEHGQPDGPDIFAGELERIVAHAGSGLDALRDFRRPAHGQLHGRDPGPGYRHRKQSAVRRRLQVQRPGAFLCATIAMVLGLTAQFSCRGFRNVSRR